MTLSTEKETWYKKKKKKAQIFVCLCWLVRRLNMDFNLRPDYIQLRANYDILLVKLLQNEKKN